MERRLTPCGTCSRSILVCVLVGSFILLTRARVALDIGRAPASSASAGQPTEQADSAYYVSGMEKMNVDQYRQALQRKLSAYDSKGGVRPKKAAASPKPGEGGSYMDFLSKKKTGQ